MDSSEQHDERELEVIREEMERKRAALADKLGALENQVLGTVQTATEAVGDVKEVVTTVKDTISDTASSVKETVTDTVQTVAETFNISRHVANHPWPAMGCAVAAGFAGGLLLGGSRQESTTTPADFGRPLAAPPAPVPPPASAEKDREGLGSQLLGSLGEAWERLSGGVQGLAVGSLMGLINQMARSSLPQSIVSDVTRFIDDVKDKLGGKTTELSEHVVNSVSEAISSPKEETPEAATSSQGKAGEAPAGRQQQRNGPRHRAASGR